jgi:hypothetical protein
MRMKAAIASLSREGVRTLMESRGQERHLVIVCLLCRHLCLLRIAGAHSKSRHYSASACYRLPWLCN